MPDREAKKKTEIKKSAVSAPVEIGKPKEGSEKDIRWYVIHTYSGYENKVKDTLTRKVHSMGMDDTIIQILLPMHDEEEVKDGEKQNAGSIRLTFFDIFSDKTKQFGFKAVFPSGKVLACLGDEPFNEKCRRNRSLFLMKRPNVLLRARIKNKLPRQMLKWAIPLRSPADRLPTAALWCWTCLMTEARLKLISVISAQRQL